MRYFNARVAYLSLCIIFSCSCFNQLTGQEVEIIEDSTYADSAWLVEIVNAVDGTEMHEQHLTDGNPGAYRFMRHILPRPPTSQGLTTIEVVHIYLDGLALPAFPDTILFIDYSEDIRLINLPWEDAFVVSAPVIYQNNTYYRCTQETHIIGDTTWTTGVLSGLTANDFVALDGSGAHPNFNNPDSMLFGFWRVHTRGFTLPPVPPDQYLIYEHGSDNFKVTVYFSEPGNRRPVANPDQYYYYRHSEWIAFPVTANDSDPDGDHFWISNYTQTEPQIGGTRWHSADSIEFAFGGSFRDLDDPAIARFTYTISDGVDTSNDAIVEVFLCSCPYNCFPLLGLPINFQTTEKPVVRSGFDTLDIDLFRRLRDNFLEPDTIGIQIVNFYYDAIPELMELLLIERPDLGMQSYRTLEMTKPAVTSLLDGDGTELITQELVDSVNLFLDSLLVAVSDTLRDSLNILLAKLCPLQDLVGLPVAEAATQVFCDTLSTYVEDQNRVMAGMVDPRPNPFMYKVWIQLHLASTSEVRLSIIDMSGRHIRTLLNDKVISDQEALVMWDGSNDDGMVMPAGMYLVQLQTDAIIQIERLVFLH